MLSIVPTTDFCLDQNFTFFICSLSLISDNGLWFSLLHSCFLNNFLISVYLSYSPGYVELLLTGSYLLCFLHFFSLLLFLLLYQYVICKLLWCSYVKLLFLHWSLFQTSCLKLRFVSLHPMVNLQHSRILHG